MQKKGPSQDRKLVENITAYQRDRKYVSLDDVANAIGLTKGGVRWIMRDLNIGTYKFTYDTRSYITKEDANKIKSLRRTARVAPARKIAMA